MALLIKKFGGTSVGSIEKIKSIAKHICESKENGNDLVIVVSQWVIQQMSLIH